MEELKNGLCELKEMVCSLKAETDEKNIIEKLKKIEEKLIGEYVIEVEGITIEPLWVEAYYFHKNVFSDCNTHLSEKQKNRFGQLYFHEKGRGGFDLCLSDSEDYYLSFLLKRTSINGEFVKQADAEDVLEKNGKTKEALEAATVVLTGKEPKKDDVKHAVRIGLAKPCYKEEELAAFSLNALEKQKGNFISDRKSVNPAIKEAMEKYISENEGLTKKEYENHCRTTYGWYPDCVSKMIQEKIEAAGK
ncbi:MAG: hypothetical protein PUK54_09025 [Firmicutes bacterium]|nr:hypothetical protein [Bacillota bacterium]MDY5857512.1 hypothetical protein [Anaerovoracaceae bacterium]